MPQSRTSPCLPPMDMRRPRVRRAAAHVVIGLTAFLTVVDLFATQAILPSLARA